VHDPRALRKRLIQKAAGKELIIVGSCFVGTQGAQGGKGKKKGGGGVAWKGL